MSTDDLEGDARPDPFLSFTGDRAAAARLRANLTQIAREHPDTPIAAIANEVLAGRRPIRDLADDDEFGALIEVGMDDYRRFLDSLTPEKRTQMVQGAKSTVRPDQP